MGVPDVDTTSVVQGACALVGDATPDGELSVTHLQTNLSVVEGMCSLNEVREQTPSSRRSVVHSQSSHKVDVLSKGQVRGVVLDNRFTCGLGEKPKSLEDMGIDIDLYKGAVRGCSPEELRHHIEGYWSLPPEDRGRLTRPMTMHVTVTVVLNGVCWRLKCLVDGGAARNVLSSSVYEDMQKRGLKHDGSVSVPRLSDISGKKVKATEGARMNISILPRKEKCKVVVYKAAIGQHLGYDMVLGAPFLNRYWVTPLYQWMVLYIGRTRGKEGPWVMGSVERIVDFMRDRASSGEKANPSQPKGRGGRRKAPEKRGKARGKQEISGENLKKPVFLAEKTSRVEADLGVERLINAHPVEQGSVGSHHSGTQLSEVREESSGTLRVTWKTPQDTKHWISTRLRRIRPFEKGRRSRVLPRGKPTTPPSASSSVARKPLGIVEVWRRAKRDSATEVPVLARSTTRVDPRGIEGRRHRLKMMCLMAARQGRNVESNHASPLSALVDEPEDIVVDCMKDVREDEGLIPVFVAADSTTGGGCLS